MRGVFAFNHLPLITDACQRCLGVALLPETQVRAALDSGQLTQVLPDWTGHEIEYFVVYPNRKLLPRFVRLVLDEVLASFPSVGNQIASAEIPAAGGAC